MKVDGKAIAEKLYGELAREREKFGEIRLGILVGDKNPVTDSYVTIKEKGANRLNITLVRKELPEGATTEDAVKAMRTLATETDGVIPQLPLARGMDTEQVIEAVPKSKDIDVLSNAAYLAYTEGRWSVIPPVPAALAYILRESGIDVRNKKIVALGRGRLVGKPTAILFKQLGAHVDLLGPEADIPTHTRKADIIILGTGVPGILKPDMIRAGAAILDAGTSELGSKIVGDADPEVEAKAGLFTPVPGGVGPVAIAMIYKNLFELKRLQMTQ